MIASAQIPLPFKINPNFTEADFVSSNCNSAAYNLVKLWPDWLTRCAIIYGPPGCGKTHLAHLWSIKAGASFIQERDFNPQQACENNTCIIIDDIEKTEDQENLLHLYNLVNENSKYLLLIGKTPPQQWPFDLPDLTSRLQLATQAAIEAPDDTVLKAVLMKLFTDYQLRVNENVINYLINRIERSFHAAQQIVQRINDLALSQQKNITIPLLREILDKY